MPIPAPPEFSLVEAIDSLRAMRRLAPDPVSEQDLRFLVDAATQAPSASNGQHWAFIIVTDAEQRRRLAAIYREVGRAVIRDQALASGRLPPETEKVYRNAMVLVEGMGSVPALTPVGRPRGRFGPVLCTSSEQVTHWNRWENPRSGTP